VPTTSVISILMMTFDHAGKVRIVFHPSSGKGVGERRAQHLASSLREAGIGCELIDTFTNSPADGALTRGACRALVMVGGDGLIHRMLPLFVGTGIPVGLIPAGSGNDLWRMLGHRNEKESTERIISFCQNQEGTVSIDALELKFDVDQGQTKYAIGAVSWGAEAKINAEANALPRQLGAFRYIIGLLLALPKLKSFCSKVTTEQFSFEGPALAASIANIRSLGGGIQLFPEADFTDGLLELSMVKGTKVMPVLPSIGKILRGSTHPGKVNHHLSSAYVETKQDSFSDGEYVGTGNFEVRVLTGAIEFIG